VFLHNLDDVITALHRSDVGSHFTGVYALKAKTLPELVLSMQSHSLRFARGLPGDEKAYVHLYSALNFLGRGPDASGLNHWVTQLQTGQGTLESVAEGFLGSVAYARKN